MSVHKISNSVIVHDFKYVLVLVYKLWLVSPQAVANTINIFYWPWQTV